MKGNMNDIITKILNERREISELSADTLKQYVGKGSKRIADIKSKGYKKTSAEAGEMLHLDKNIAKATTKVKSKISIPAKSEPVKPHHDKAALHSQLKDLKGKFDPAYQHSDDHSVYTKHRDIHAKITDIEKKLRESEDLDELSTSTLDSYADKAKKSSSALMNKAGRSKNLTRAMELLNKSGKRQDGATKATAKSSFKKAGQRWGVTESEAHAADLEEAIVVHSSKEKDGKEYQVLSRKNNREFVIQSKKKDGTWHTHDAVGTAQRARQLITTGRYSLNEADKVQTVTITVPALIRLCEIAREDLGEDTDLHEFIEEMISSSNGVIDSETLGDVESVAEGEIVSADKKVGKDGRLYPRSKKTIDKATDSLTGVKL